MIEHPVPQNITEYRFHLIGNMTVKQFLILLAGSGIAFLFYTTNLPALIKWPIMFAFFSIGAVAAFVPYEERTVDQWIVIFFKAIYRPTKYYWRRYPRMLDIFNYTPKTENVEPQPQDWVPNKQEQVQAYLSSLSNATPAPTDPLDVLAQDKKINLLFSQIPAAANIQPGQIQVDQLKPNLQVKARPLSSPAPSDSSANPPNSASSTSSTAVAQSQSSPMASKSTALPKPTTKKVSTPDNPSTPVRRRGMVTILPSEKKPTTFNQQAQPEPTLASPPPAIKSPSGYVVADKFQSSSKGQQEVKPAIFDKNLPFPSLPTEKNVVVGMVHNAAGQIVPGAIVEILDQQGGTVRAMKTNALGQFYISSPLPAGTYFIETESAKYSFPIYQLDLTDQVLEPVNIQANHNRNQSLSPRDKGFPT